MTKYILGYLLSVVLTLGAFGLVFLHNNTNHTLPIHAVLYGGLAVLAVVQLCVQLAFFFHIGKGASLQWNLTVLAFSILIVVIVVGGTLWIMNNLERAHPMHDVPYQNGVISPQTER